MRWSYINIFISESLAYRLELIAGCLDGILEFLKGDHDQRGGFAEDSLILPCLRVLMMQERGTALKACTSTSGEIPHDLVSVTIKSWKTSTTDTQSP